jgi:TetR/AcrR family transcriptional repressor of lmrAB and yxaGH operons
MAKYPDSKEKTIVAAARLLRGQGYRGTALNDILDAGGSPRGSLYFHFPRGKEEIGEAALAFAAEGVRRAIAAASETSESAEVFLIRIVRGMAADLARSDFKEGCPIATTALETTAQSEILGAAARDAFRKWEQEIRRGLERFGMKPQRADLVATTVLSQVEGALLLARTYRDLEPMHRAEAAVKLLAGADARNRRGVKSPSPTMRGRKKET